MDDGRRLRYVVCRPLVDTADAEDDRIARALVAGITQTMALHAEGPTARTIDAAASGAAAGAKHASDMSASGAAVGAKNTSAVVICDHGSPVAAVTYVRNHVAAQVAGLLAANHETAHIVSVSGGLAYLSGSDGAGICFASQWR